jgi:streptomycin 6-kinase
MPAQPQAHFRLTNARNLIETIPTHVMEVKNEGSIDEEMVGKEREEEEKMGWDEMESWRQDLPTQ